MAKAYKAITNVPGWVEMLASDGVPDSIATLYKRVPILYRAVQLRCDALSSLPIKIYKGEENVVDWPYPTRLGELIWKWEASCLLSGAAFGEIVKNKSGFRKDVKYRNPYDITTQYFKTGELKFKQNSSGATWTNNLQAGTYEMFYIHEYDPVQDILPGVGAAIASTVDSKLLYAISKFPETYFEGGAMPVTLLGVETTDRNEIERMQNWFRRSATSIKNAFRVLGVKADSIQTTTLTPPLKDMVFSDLNDMAKYNIALAFGIKQTMLDSEAANYATAQEDRLSFYEDTIRPRARLFEDALNTQLLAKDGLRLKFAFEAMDIFQKDENDRADLLSKFTQSGLPIELALQLAGYELTDDQVALMNARQEQASNEPVDEQKAELRKWQRMAEKRVKEGKELRNFESAIIEPSLHEAIAGALETVKTADDVRQVFDSVIAWSNYP